jgi:hypothetical protein
LVVRGVQMSLFKVWWYKSKSVGSLGTSIFSPFFL